MTKESAITCAIGHTAALRVCLRRPGFASGVEDSAGRPRVKKTAVWYGEMASLLERLLVLWAIFWSSTTLGDLDFPKKDMVYRWANDLDTTLVTRLSSLSGIETLRTVSFLLYCFHVINNVAKLLRKAWLWFNRWRNVIAGR